MRLSHQLNACSGLSSSRWYNRPGKVQQQLQLSEALHHNRHCDANKFSIAQSAHSSASVLLPAVDLLSFGVKKFSFVINTVGKYCIHGEGSPHASQNYEKDQPTHDLRHTSLFPNNESAFCSWSWFLFVFPRIINISSDARQSARIGNYCAEDIFIFSNYIKRFRNIPVCSIKILPLN